MAIARHFLGWDKPILPRAAVWLADRFTADRVIDLDAVTVLMPGRRAARRLVELLLEQAEQRGLIVLPPRCTTPGALPEQLYCPTRPPADPLVEQLAWIRACRDLTPSVMQQLTASPPDRDDLLAWWSLARRLQQCHVELAGESLDFNDVAQRGLALVDFPETDRWAALATIQQAYHDLLEQQGVIDLHRARHDALRTNQCRAAGPIVCIGIVELTGVLRGMLEQVADAQPVHALVAAPDDLADCFDSLGCLIPERWRDRSIKLDDEALAVVEGPDDQALHVLHTIESYHGRYAAEQITIGVPDSRILPCLRQHLTTFGVPVRDAAGLALTHTAVARLLQAVADYLAEQRYSDLATLVRHPDLSRWLVNQPAQPPISTQAIDAWLDVMDRYYTDHLQGRWTGQWLGDPSFLEPVKQVYQAVADLLGPLGKPRPLSQWSGPLCQLLLNVYADRPMHRQHPSERIVIAVCGAVRDELVRWSRLPADFDETCPADLAIRLLLARLADHAIAPAADQAAVELLGSLELVLDDAPAMIVTSFNEDFLPTSVSADPFLPNALRNLLGLLNNDRRYSRDAFALTVLHHSRRDLSLIAARVDSAGDPLRPSRLMFATDPRTIARRVQRFYNHCPPARIIDPTHFGVTETSAFDHNWPPPPDLADFHGLSRLHVTAFGHYLACPYRFYLSHILKLGAIDDRADELDAAQFGTLIHAILAEFGRAYRGDPADAKAIEAFCRARLDQRFRASFGDDVSTAVLLQREQLRLRLADFAQWQAHHAAAGWRIRHVELTVDNAPLSIDDQPFQINGQPFQLHGRIDRVDVNETNGCVAIFDYKTFEKAQTPESKHQSAGQWIDLQLPLYRHLLAATALGPPDRLGYLCLTRDGCEEKIASWKEDDLRDADELAAEIIRKINAGVFYPPADPPPPFDDFAALCGTGQLFDRDADEDHAEDAR